MNIFNYSDYRAYLRSYIQKLPKQGRGVINRLAAYLEVHPSLLSQVLSDSKNLSLEQAYLTREYLGLSEQEGEYFMCLVQFERAGTIKLKNYFKEKMALLKEDSAEIGSHLVQDRQLTEEEKSIFYSHWLYTAIWLYTGVQKEKTLDEIVQRFQIPRERASEILRFLVKTNLCIFKNSAYQSSSHSIHIARNSAHAHKHHTNWRLRAIESRDNVSEEEIMYTAPFSISRKDFNYIRERIFEVLKDVTNTAVRSEAEDLACFNIDFFWIKK